MSEETVKPLFIADDVKEIKRRLHELEESRKPKYKMNDFRMHLLHGKMLCVFINITNYQRKFLKPLCDGIVFEGFNLKYFDMSRYADDDKSMFKLENFLNRKNIFVFDFVICHASNDHQNAIYNLAKHSFGTAPENRQSQAVFLFNDSKYKITSGNLIDRLYRIISIENFELILKMIYS